MGTSLRHQSQSLYTLWYLGYGLSELVEDVSLLFTIKLTDVSQFGVLELKEKILGPELYCLQVV